MSPRRKSGLSKDDLEALKHLPAVIRALENLQEQHAKVRALMGLPGSVPRPVEGGGITELTAPRVGLESGAAMQLRRGEPVDLRAAANPILDTPERREYEAAKKAGKEVPPDLANISDAQRERMAEQRALIQAERQRKGLPPSAVEVLPRSGAMRAPVTPEDERMMLEAVRVEELPATVNGSVGAEEE